MAIAYAGQGSRKREKGAILSGVFPQCKRKICRLFDAIVCGGILAALIKVSKWTFRRWICIDQRQSIVILRAKCYDRI